MDYNVIIETALQGLTEAGFYASLGIASPTLKEAMTSRLFWHDMLDHWYNPSGEVIEPTLYGEALGLINKAARDYIRELGGYPKPIDLLREFYKEFPVDDHWEDKSSELEEMIAVYGKNFFVHWMRQCVTYWRNSEVLKSLQYE